MLLFIYLQILNEYPQCAKHCSRPWGLIHKTDKNSYPWEVYILVQPDTENLFYAVLKEVYEFREIQLKLPSRSIQIKK